MRATDQTLAGASTLIAALAAACLAALPAPAHAEDGDPPATASGPAQIEAPVRQITLSAGSGQLVRLPRPVSGMFVADDKIADIQVKSSSQLYLFGKSAGETSVFATDRAGNTVWSAQVRVGNNIGGVGQMLRMVMPDASISVQPIGNMLLLSGTAANPKDIEEAERLVVAYTGGTNPVVNRIRTATPQQVYLQVKIAEVSRDLIKTIGTNLLTRDRSGGFLFGIGRGTPGTITTVTDPGTTGLAPGATAYAINNKAGLTTIGGAGHLLGLDLLSTLDLGETDGLVTTLAEPTLTALSGESASFLAGGEIPIPISQGLGAVSIEYKRYGVSLSFTPVVLSDGRISLKVSPEVSQLTSAGSVTLNGFTVPGISSRRADTTVELGSGQSFMIGGLLNNNTNNSTDKTPGIGSLPVIGALFRSNSFRRQQTELVIIVTPYLVKPVDAKQIALPTDGYKAPTDLERVLLGKTYSAAKPAHTPAPAPAPAK